MAQTRSESPRQTDDRAHGARPGDAALTAQDLDAVAAASGVEPLDLAQQIDSLLNEIEQASSAADPWGDAAQRAADSLKDGEERTLEPSQKLLAKVREGAGVEMPGAGVGAVAAADAGASMALPEGLVAPEAVPEIASAAADDVAVPEPDALAEALDAVPADSQAAAVEPAAPAVGGAASATEEPTLAAELDAALKEAGDALEQIVPPEDPPVEASAGEPAGVVMEEVVEVPPAASMAVVEQPAAAHRTNSGAPAAPTAEPVAVGTAEAPPAAETSEVEVNADDLDAALAAQAEELEESSRAAPTPAPASVPADAPPVGESALAPQVVQQAAPAADGLAPSVQGAAPHVTQHSTVAAAANKTTTGAAHTTTRPDANAPVVVPEAKPAKAPDPAKPSFMARLRAPLNRLGNMLAMPLSLLPESARDMVAYLAAVTVFNALAVWCYMLFIHTPTVPPPAHDAPALHATEPVAQAHGEHGDAHAPGGHGGAEHGEAKGDGHAKPSDGEHGEKAETAHAPSASHAAESHEASHGEAPGHGAAHEAAPH